MKFGVLTILFALLVPAPSAASGAAPADTENCIALARGDGESPVIMARVNDAGPFAFVLDTGSSGTTLDDRRIKQLALVPDGPSEEGQGMGGAIDVRLFRLRTFAAGPLALHDLVVPGIPAPSLASHDIAGLAGVDIFGAHLATWRWDRACVFLTASGSQPVGQGWRPVRSRWLKPWKILLPVRIGKASGWGLLDTGAQKSILSPGFARAAGLGGSIAGADTITGVEGRETRFIVHDLRNATFGAWQYRNVKIGVAALPLFDRLGGMDEPLAVIGMDWIADRPFGIDYGSQSVWQKVRAPGR